MDLFVPSAFIVSRLWAGPSAVVSYREQIMFLVFALLTYGRLLFILFLSSKQGQNDAAKIRTRDSGIY